MGRRGGGGADEGGRQRDREEIGRSREGEGVQGDILLGRDGSPY